MFSAHIPGFEEEILGWRTAGQGDCSAFAAAFREPSVARTLWWEDFGRDTALSQCLRNTASTTKRTLFRDRLYAIVPLYVTSICQERCTYCNFRADNKGVAVERVRLNDDELLSEASYLVSEKGLRVIELVYATDAMMRIDTICRHVEIVSNLLERSGGGVVGLNAEPFDETDYRRLLNAGLSFAVLWQETYDRGRYAECHPGRTKKTDFAYRADAYERMISAGLSHYGMGILSGLSDWRFDWAMLFQHEHYLRRRYGVGPSIVGIPRLKAAAGALVQRTSTIPNTAEFRDVVALHNIYAPDVLPFVSTRENWDLCLDLSDGGGSLFTLNCSTIPGGYSLGHVGYQFPTLSYDAPTYATRLHEQGRDVVFDWSFAELLREAATCTHNSWQTASP